MKNEDQNIIGLETEKSNRVADALNVLLADHQIFYQNLRGFHWLILGKNFFQLHEKYEELYNHTAEIIDEIAERILMLGGTPLHTFESYIEKAELKSVQNVRGSKETLEVIEQNMLILLSKVRETLTSASENNDEGTVSLLSGLISEYEKTLWMFSAFNTNID